MLLLIPILLLLICPAIMLVIHLARPAYLHFWLVAVLCALLAWPVVLFTGLRLPQTVDFSPKGMGSLFETSPTLLADSLSWPLALALSTLLIAVLFTAVARARQGHWRSWASSSLLVGFGLVAVLAGNPLTLLLAWAAIDLAELLTLFAQVYSSEAREQIVAAFSARVGGMILLIWAGVIARLEGVPLSFTEIPLGSSIFLLLAGGLRLGVLPLHLPYLHELPLRRGLGVSLRLVPVASSLVLLVRTATVGIPTNFTPFLFLLAGLAALYGALAWAAGRDELFARPYWLLGMSSFVVGAAVRAQPGTALSWSLACLLPGALLFLSHARHRALLFLPALGLLGLSGLTFTPGWGGVGLYLPYQTVWQSLPLLLFFTANVFFMVGYVRYAIQPGEDLAGAERWVWVIYTLGLALLPLAHFLAAWRLFPDLERLQITGWLSGPAVIFAALLLWVARKKGTQLLTLTAPWQRVLSFSWFYRSIWYVYQAARRILDWVTTFLEGEAGILWALLLLALIFSMLSSPGPGG